MAEEDESCYGAYYLHLDAAGELNPFTVLGVTPVTALTDEAPRVLPSVAFRPATAGKKHKKIRDWSTET